MRKTVKLTNPILSVVILGLLFFGQKPFAAEKKAKGELDKAAIAKGHSKNSGQALSKQKGAQQKAAQGPLGNHSNSAQHASVSSKINKKSPAKTEQKISVSKKTSSIAPKNTTRNTDQRVPQHSSNSNGSDRSKTPKSSIFDARLGGITSNKKKIIHLNPTSPVAAAGKTADRSVAGAKVGVPAGSPNDDLQLDDPESQKLAELLKDSRLNYLDSEDLDQWTRQYIDIEKYRVCAGDGYNRSNSQWEEDVADSCMLPKLSIASRLFNVRYSFAKCIFEKENRERDRLAEKGMGHGLAQLVNTTMIEIQRRWERDDKLALTLRKCIRLISNREEIYRLGVEAFSFPKSIKSPHLRREAIRSEPTDQLNPLYRDDAVCLGIMTMAIKVAEARADHSGPVSDTELARRYNSSWMQKSYAKEIVSCIAQLPAHERRHGGTFGFIEIPEFSESDSPQKNK